MCAKKNFTHHSTTTKSSQVHEVDNSLLYYSKLMSSKPFITLDVVWKQITILSQVEYVHNDDILGSW